MSKKCFRLSLFVSVVFLATFSQAQSNSTLRGTITDSSGAVIAGANITATNTATGIKRTATTDASGNYNLAALPNGTYNVQVAKSGMQTQAANNVVLPVAQIVVQNFQLGIAKAQEVVEVTGEVPVVESSTMTVGQVINERTVQEIPLNGRHFVDLGLLVPGSVTPPQNGFLTAPLRGQGSFAINTAGNREDTVNFMVNGVNLNDMAQNQITFQPSINTVDEFKVDNSTYSADYGRNSGAIVNIATRSGTNKWHGEGFDFLRNNVFDARNFFNKQFTTSGQHVAMSPFKRNNFGASLGGPIWKDKTFFFFSYEGLRQRQGLTINSGDLPSGTTSSNAGVQKLINLLPTPNGTSSTGIPQFIGSATAPVNIDQWTLDISHNFSEADHLHGYYAFQKDKRQEPTLQGDTVPAFGDTRSSHRQIFTLDETHVFSSAVVNDARLGFNRIFITFAPNFVANPADYGIADGITSSIGIPQITIRDIGVTFGGPAGFPQGRGDTTAVFSDSLSWLKGNHSFKFGGEFRRGINDNFAQDIGTLTFNCSGLYTTSTCTAGGPGFLTGQANTFVITPGQTPSRIFDNAVGAFAMDSWKVRSNVTLELGGRFDWNATPTEGAGRFTNFIAATDSLLQTNKPYDQNFAFEPRVGMAWDLFGDGKTVLRIGYGYMIDQPVFNTVSGLSSNPPFGSGSVSYSSSKTPIPIGSLITSAASAGSLTLNAVNPSFKDAHVQQYNLNVQHQLTDTMGMMIGYFGSQGGNLRIARNLNQLSAPTGTGTKLYPTLSTSSPIDPGATLGNITQIDSAGSSNYNALWVTLNKQFAHGLQFNTSYTWSKSLDTNSLNSQGVIVQDSYDVNANYGMSDFDVRHRYVANLVYDLPFKRNRLVGGWEAATIVQAQSGSPVTILTGGSFNTANVLRPDQLAPISITNTINSQGNITWFTANTCKTTPTSGCQLLDPATRFGDMQRNAVEGPGFWDIDFSAIKKTKITERLTSEFRVEAFNVFNHPNFGLPGRVMGSSTFGVIQSTRFPVGDSGSSRQLQFAIKLDF